MKKLNICSVFLGALVALGASFGLHAQVAISEDFTDVVNNNPWYYFNGACLTASRLAGIEPSMGIQGQIPGCVTIGASYYREPLVGGQNGVAGNAQTLPDPVGKGALRFTNGSPGGFAQNGGILSTNPFPTGQGVSITFKTVTYRGNSGGAGRDGADGISFYLMDAAALDPTTITGTSAGDGNGLGSWGGSLGYTCSNANPPFNGLIGAYVGLGIDEYGNFLNGVALMPGYLGPNNPTGDNSALGYGYKPGRIGLRGAGNVAWNWLHSNYYTAAYGATVFTPAQQQAAVRATCRSGIIADPVNPANPLLVSGAAVPVYDYAPIPNAYVELAAATQIANEAAMNRGLAVPIFYHLKISQNGLMSFGYSINGGAYTSVIKNQSISASNGPLPANFLFGFAGSTGGATNIHEILCFKADPATTADNSAGVSEKQSAKIQTGAQAYFAYYNPATWTGRVTASGLGLDALGNVIIAATPNWDGSCTLTGVDPAEFCQSTGAPGPITALAPDSRTILSWNGSQGIPFRFGNLTSSPGGGQRQTINFGDATPYNANRVNFLRGDRTNEIDVNGVGLFRSRVDNILGDVVDSSPVWVGPPIDPYVATWGDRLYAAAMPENAVGAQTYPQFTTAEQTRLNVVYVGSNDGLLHGFRSGSYDATGTFVNNAATPNDGVEVLAYMPGAIVNTIHSATANVDFSSPLYGHNFFVDATPGSGDVFYGGQWHSWLVGGLGEGGSALYALDVTTPTSANFTEGNASSLVVGEWSAANLVCANVANCANNLGKTYGTPQLRRLHDGKWAVIFGNGYGSVSGDAGIFIMTIDPATAARTFYYLSTNTGSPGTPNGIAYPSAADLDGDHVSDYVYAGDLLGNLWRFDLTSNREANWQLTPGPLFAAGANQPITTALVLASGSPSAGAQQQLMIMFGTGRKFPLTNNSPTTFAPGTQGLYSIWDWNLTAWNASSGAQYASLTGGQAGGLGLGGGNRTMTNANLQSQAITIDPATFNRDIVNAAAICWAGPVACNATPQYGWYINLPGVQEQIIYGPQLVAQALTVNSLVPASNSPISCLNVRDAGFTYVLSALSGAAFNQVFLPPAEAANAAVNTNPAYLDAHAVAMQTNATGSSFVVANNAGTKYLVYETNQVQNGTNNILGGALGLNLPTNTSGRRLSWVERR